MSDTSSTLNQVLLHPDRRFGADLDAWLIDIGGDGLEQAITDPDSILPTIKEAQLLGLGGSGFPTHIKWEFVANEPNNQDKYLICNGNEDEPGTFKDRLLLEENGMTANWFNRSRNCWGAHWNSISLPAPASILAVKRPRPSSRSRATSPSHVANPPTPPSPDCSAHPP